MAVACADDGVDDERRPGAMAVTDEVLRHLEIVEQERRARDADPELRARVVGLKRFQQRRLEGTHADLLGSARFGSAARFFLAELYGPADFRQRDSQFARIVPRVERVFPMQVSATILDLVRLHALSEVLDTAMARHLSDESPDPPAYVRAWLSVGRSEDRARQLDLVVAIGHSIDRLTGHTWLVAGLKMMRGPARAAGLFDLQQFLEKGLASFRSMGGASAFLATIEERERRLMHSLFCGDIEALASSLPMAPKET
jgi:hypothetical protein